MNYLNIHTWRRSSSLHSEPFPRQMLHEQLLLSCPLEAAALSRLESRIQARCAVAIPLRPEADVSELTAWFAAAGGISSQVTALNGPGNTLRDTSHYKPNTLPSATAIA